MDQRRHADPAPPVLLQRVAAGEDQGVELARGRGRSRRCIARPAAAARPPGCMRTQFGAVAGFRSYFQSRCIGQISQCSCAVMIRTARRFVPRPRTPGPADQRDVVEVDHVGVDGVEGLAQGLAT